MVGIERLAARVLEDEDGTAPVALEPDRPNGPSPQISIILLPARRPSCAAARASPVVPTVVVSGREISVDDHHHLPAGLIGLHDAMRFADLLEAKHAGRPGL